MAIRCPVINVGKSIRRMIFSPDIVKVKVENRFLTMDFFSIPARPFSRSNAHNIPNSRLTSIKRTSHRTRPKPLHPSDPTPLEPSPTRKSSKQVLLSLSKQQFYLPKTVYLSNPRFPPSPTPSTQFTPPCVINRTTRSGSCSKRPRPPKVFTLRIVQRARAMRRWV